MELREQLRIWRLAEQGYSARAIGRQIRRDHHTVRRHLQSERVQLLAMKLALIGQNRKAREMGERLGCREGIERLIIFGRELSAPRDRTIARLSADLLTR